MTSPVTFTLEATDGMARRGRIDTHRGTVHTSFEALLRKAPQDEDFKDIRP